MEYETVKSRFVSGAGEIPVLGRALKRLAHLYSDGSVVTIRLGAAAGMKWRRHHRFLSSFWIGNFEWRVQRAFQKLISPGDVVYDVGAHAGFFSLIGSRLAGPSGNVFAFEPNPDCANSVREQIDLNHLANCQAVEMAVGDRDGEVGFLLKNATSRVAEGGDYLVPMTTLDTFARTHPRPDFVKIDVEGGEGAVLRGSQTIMGAKFLIELHGERPGLEVVSILKGRGYRFLDLDLKESTTPHKEVHLIALP